MKSCECCKKEMNHEVKHLIAYRDSVPQYSQFCKACHKAFWLRFKEENPELWKSLNDK